MENKITLHYILPGNRIAAETDLLESPLLLWLNFM